KVDLNLLRLAVYELLTYPNISAGVTINEAIEIARRYCSDDAPVFVNGVLDRIAEVVGKKAQRDESSEYPRDQQPREPARTHALPPGRDRAQMATLLARAQ